MTARRNRKAERMANIYSGVLVHGGSLVVLLMGLEAAGHIDGFNAGGLFGLDTSAWVTLNVVNAMAHQVYVWFCWRFELHAGLLTRWLGSAAFRRYSVLFILFLAARLLLIVCLAVANQDSFPLSDHAAWAASVLLSLPVIYVAYSVVKYFGFERALGIDHFDRGYWSMELVEHGIFRFAPNAMYLFGFLVLWIPGLMLHSIAALTVALFSHVYIWVHYYCTEKPDMRYIYGGSRQAHRG